MRKRNLRVRVVGTFCLCILATCVGQASNKNKELEEALKTEYKLARIGFDRLRITEPGTILVIQKEGVFANPSIDFGNQTDSVINGEVHGPKMGLFTDENDRDLKVGTRVYMTRIDIRNDGIRFDIITCETFDVNVHGNTKNIRYSATLDFKLSGASLEAGDAKAIKKVVDAVLQPESEANEVQSKTVKLGQTLEEVKAILGAPDKILDLGAKQVFVYKDIKVVFQDGKVADVQ